MRLNDLRYEIVITLVLYFLGFTSCVTFRDVLNWCNFLDSQDSLACNNTCLKTHTQKNLTGQKTFCSLYGSKMLDPIFAILQLNSILFFR